MSKFEACIRLRRMLSDELLRKLTCELSNRGAFRIDPVFSPREGFRYKRVEEIMELDGDAARKLLEELHQMGFLKRTLFDKTVFCPDCGSPNISIHLNCPSCGNMNTSKLSLVEDLSCGYIGKESDFKRGGRTVCPHCGRQLLKPGIDFRRIGIWYVCNACGSEFDLPVVTYKCRECTRMFSMEDATYEPVYSYQLDESIREVAIMVNSLTDSLAGFLRSNGFTVECPGAANGRSGQTHTFDLIAKGGQDKSMAVEIYVSDDPLPERTVTTVFAKLYDTALSGAILIAIPRVSEEGRRLANLYGIRLVEGASKDEVLRNFGSALSSLSGSA